MTYELWAANPHQFGAGKIHYINPEEPRRTLCGKWLEATPGSKRIDGAATCVICLNKPLNEAESERRRAEWQSKYEAEKVARERQYRIDRDAERRRYGAYLQSTEWRSRRDLVLRRDGFICRACLVNKATEVHHLTYEHKYAEPAFDLVSVCRPCHERISAMEGHGEE